MKGLANEGCLIAVMLTGTDAKIAAATASLEREGTTDLSDRRHREGWSD